ncbi:MAG TPA: PDZ domain-containing protein, partial [Isosphaeraceae bacterium]|nr:PDZ domain-containing protein [Isosphaeraceae bacterium]
PTCNLGRIGLCWSRKTPGTAFAIVDCEKIGMGPPQAMVADVYLGIQGEDAETGARLTQISDNSPASKAGLQAGDIVLGIDTKTILGYQQLVEQIKGHKPGDKLTARIARKKELKEIAITLEARPGSQASKTHPFGSRLNSQVENVQAKQGKEGFQYGGVYKTTDGGDTWVRINSLNPRPMYFSQVRVDPSDDNRIYVLGIALYRSSDGGKTFKSDGGKGAHPDHHALWIDPRDGRHMILGTDGGFYATYDRMEHWDYLNTTALGQFYHVAVDMRKPYYVYGGLQDNGSWGGPSRSLHGSGPTNDDWFLLGGGDGFVCRIDPIDSDIVYYESQDGNMARRNLRTGEWARIQPKTAKGAPPYRFNWNAPYILSSHNPRIVYSAGNYVFRSVKQGDDLRPISPEITRTKRGSGTALAESTRNPEVLWAGTDDGALWVTRDGGIKWTNVADKLGLPGPRWVSSIEASRFVEGRAYVVFDAHRSDDDQPYVYVTEDFGQTWKSLNANLPWGSTRVLREDAVNPNLLYLGTEFAVWVSLDRGQTWHKLNNNLPTVAVHEIAVHPTAGEIVAATHGRSLWILDVVPLRQMTAEVARQKAHLFEPRPVVRWRSEPSKGSPFGTGSRNFVGQNPPRGAQIYYSLSQKAEKVGLKIVDAAGKTVRELQAKGDPGLHRVTWDLMTGPPRPQGPGGGSGGRRPMGEGGGERPMGEQPAPTAVPAG